MKQTIILLIIASIFGCSDPKLKVTIGKSENGKAYLFNSANQKMDTIEYKDYAFAFADSVKEPTLYHLYFEKINDLEGPIFLILSKEPTEIKFDSLLIPNKTASSFSDFYPNRPVFVKDPNQNIIFYQFQSLWISFSDSIISLSKNEQDIIYRKKEREKIYNTFILRSEQLISENKDKLVSAVILEHLMKDNLLEINKIQELYSLLDISIQKSNLGQRIGLESGFNKTPKALKFEFKDQDGNDYNSGNKQALPIWKTYQD